MSCTTADLLNQLQDCDVAVRDAAIAHLARAAHHDAIPQLVAWLSTDQYIYYDDKEYYGTYNDSVKLHTEAARALRRIGGAAVPALLADLEARATQKNPLHIALLRDFLPQSDTPFTRALIAHHQAVHGESLRILHEAAPYDAWQPSERRYHYYNRVAYLRNVVRPALASLHTAQAWTFGIRYATFGATEQARLIWQYRTRGWRIAPLVWAALPIMLLLNIALRLPTVMLRKAFLHTR